MSVVRQIPRNDGAGSGLKPAAEEERSAVLSNWRQQHAPKTRRRPSRTHRPLHMLARLLMETGDRIHEVHWRRLLHAQQQLRTPLPCLPSAAMRSMMSHPETLDGICTKS